MHTAKAAPWTIQERSRNVHQIAFELSTVREARWFLLQSDVHWDNPHCQRTLLEKHWQQAKDRDAGILDNGDFFCAMQGKWDKRANKSDLRPEHQCSDYLDALIRTASEALQPYRHLITLRGQGNHETGVLKHHETNLTERLVERLKTSGSETVQLGGYSGFVVFQVTFRGQRRNSFKLFYHHGYGGGGPVTRGVIDTNRQSVFLADADLVWTGHTHDSWQVPIARVKLNQDCTHIVHTRQVHVRSPGYKEEYGDGYGGFHIEKGRGPKPTGALWLRFYMADGDTPDFEITEAK